MGLFSRKKALAVREMKYLVSNTSVPRPLVAFEVLILVFY